MKRIARFIAPAILMLCIGYGNAFGQKDSLKYNKFGVGISLLSSNDLLYNRALSSIYLPINISEKFRIEPEIGFAFVNNSTDISISVGLFKTKSSKDLLLKYGLRIGTMSMENIHVSPTMGSIFYQKNLASVLKLNFRYFILMI